MPGFVRTPKDEARWSKAKDAAKRSKKKDEDSFTDQDWALVNHIYHQMGKAEELGKAVKDMMKGSKDEASVEELQSFLEKARKRLSDEAEDPYEKDDADELGEGFREFDPDEEDDDAAKWLAENDPEARQDEEEEDHGEDDRDVEEGEGEPDYYDEYGPDEDEESHQQETDQPEESDD